MVRNRMTRWLAALMLIASPALGGQVLPLIHPCAVETAQTAGHHGGQHGADHQESAPADQCTCLGSCSVSALATVAPASIVATTVVPRPKAAAPQWPDDVSQAVGRPLDLLPPPTAPPLA